jgi:ketosteroid isomerase-like protein
MSSDNLQRARRLYEGFESRDIRALLAALAPDFRGVACDGMPEGLGGSYDGPEAMLRDCWARVLVLADVRPVPDEYLAACDDRVVVIGRYLGSARRTGRPLSAAFAHILRFTDGLVTELVQITDTERWHEALAA